MPKDEVKLLFSFLVAERDSIVTNDRPWFFRALGVLCVLRVQLPAPPVKAEAAAAANQFCPVH